MASTLNELPEDFILDELPEDFVLDKPKENKGFDLTPSGMTRRLAAATVAPFYAAKTGQRLIDAYKQARQIQEEKRGVHIDVDKIAHKVLLKDEVKEELVKIYGKKIIQMNEVERKYLREIVFQSRNEMKKFTLSAIFLAFSKSFCI